MKAYELAALSPKERQIAEAAAREAVEDYCRQEEERVARRAKSDAAFDRFVRPLLAGATLGLSELFFLTLDIAATLIAPLWKPLDKWLTDREIRSQIALYQTFRVDEHRRTQGAILQSMQSPRSPTTPRRTPAATGVLPYRPRAGGIPARDLPADHVADVIRHPAAASRLTLAWRRTRAFFTGPARPVASSHNPHGFEGPNAA